jgi:transposase
MQIRKGKAPGSGRLAEIGVELSRQARVRLAWMDFYRRCGNVAHTCRHFGIGRQTFYRWQRRYDPYDLTSLEERSHRPRQCRQPTWAFPLEEKVSGLRLQFPRRGKDKLAVLLRRQKLALSVSMVGRILTRLKQQGRLVEPPHTGVPGSRRALRPRPYAVRKPREYAASEPGDLVEVDTLDVRPIPGVVFKQFTARDVVSRWDVLQAHTRATAQTATQFLDTLQLRMPFPSAPSRSMAARSLPPSSNRPASSAASICSFSLHVLPNSTAPSNAPIAPTPRSSTRSRPAPWR